MKTELFEKVYIKSEEDLPKEEGMYFVKINGDSDSYATIDYVPKENEFNVMWLKNIDWYLRPIKQDKPEKAVNFIQTRDLTDEEWLKLPKEEILQLYKNCYVMLQNYIGLSGEKIVNVPTITTTDFEIKKPGDQFKGKYPFISEEQAHYSSIKKAEEINHIRVLMQIISDRIEVDGGMNSSDLKSLWNELSDVVTKLDQVSSQFQPKEIVLPSDEEIVKWANSLEKIEDAMPGTLKLHIQKKIECRIEGAKWLRNLIEKQKGVITSKDLADIDHANEERK